MLLSTTTSPFLKRMNYEEMITIVSNAGFDALDFSFFAEEFYSKDIEDKKFKQLFTTWREIAAEKQIVYNQAHAPYPSSTVNATETVRIFDDIVRSMRNSSYLGIDTVVVHPMKHLKYADDKAPEQLFEMNIDFFKRLQPFCEEYNVKIAIENTWQLLKKNFVSHSACSTPEEHIKYLDALDSRWFCACLDIGHAILVNEKVDEYIKKLGAGRLKALHIHDSDGYYDLHTLPYYGVGNWNSITKSLKEIRYAGDFTFEAVNFLNFIPKEIFKEATMMMSATGRLLMEKVR